MESAVGPMRITGPDGIEIRGERGGIVCRVHWGTKDRECVLQTEAQDYARLFSESFDLLRAAERMLDELGDVEPAEPGDTAQSAAARLREACQRARGIGRKEEQPVPREESAKEYVLRKAEGLNGTASSGTLSASRRTQMEQPDKPRLTPGEYLLRQVVIRVAERRGWNGSKTIAKLRDLIADLTATQGEDNRAAEIVTEADRAMREKYDQPKG